MTTAERDPRLRYRADGEHYDYVLVQGARQPFLGGHPGPEFRPIARSGRFTLYERSAPEPEPDEDDEREPDRGPCVEAVRPAELR